MRKTKFEEEEVYHIYNRGVEKRNIFMDDNDRFRFIHDLFEFNDDQPAINLYYKKPFLQSHETKSHKLERRERDVVVEILAFVLMPNHFHLLLRQRKEKGIAKFMHKLGLGYTTYFNQKYQRTGALFQGTYKAILVEREAHFIHLPYYLHMNPFALKFPNWREGEVDDRDVAMQFLENYRWSSYPDYIGKHNFPSVTSRGFLQSCFGGPEEHKKNMLNWLQETDSEAISGLSLEYNAKANSYET